MLVVTCTLPTIQTMATTICSAPAASWVWNSCITCCKFDHKQEAQSIICLLRLAPTMFHITLVSSVKWPAKFHSCSLFLYEQITHWQLATSSYAFCKHCWLWRESHDVYHRSFKSSVNFWTPETCNIPKIVYKPIRSPNIWNMLWGAKYCNSQQKPHSASNSRHRSRSHTMQVQDPEEGQLRFHCDLHHA